MPVSGFLDTLRNKRVFFDPLHGNHGDGLLNLAARSMLRDASLTLVETPGTAEFILLNGGGSMVDGWFGLKRLARYSREFSNLPLAVLPSSFKLSHTSLADITGGRHAPLWLWAREQPSLEILRNAGLDDKVTLGIDHDLAFYLDKQPVVSDLKRKKNQKTILIVERDDWEGPTGRRRPLSPPGLEFIPENLRTAVRKTLLGPIRKRQDRISPFRDAALRFLHQSHPETAAMNSLVADISLAETCSFDDFLQNVANAAVIVTTRLHVAILGHLLNRRTYLVEGSYHKFKGVFEYSMQQGSSHLLRWNDKQQELRSL